MKLVICAGLLSLVSRCLHTALLLSCGFISKHSGGDSTLSSLPTTMEGMGKFLQAPALLRAQPGTRESRSPPHLCNREQTPSILLLRLHLARVIYPDFTPSNLQRAGHSPVRLGVSSTVHSWYLTLNAWFLHSYQSILIRFRSSMMCLVSRAWPTRCCLKRPVPLPCGMAQTKEIRTRMALCTRVC